MIKQFFAILLLFLVVSCNYFSSGSTYAKNNIKVLDTVIDYTSVDMYPLFSECKSMPDKYSQKKCFEGELIEKLSKSLKKIDYKVKRPVNDSSYVNFLVSNTKEIQVISIESPEAIQQNLPQLDSVIRNSFAELKVVEAASKRGIPVKSQYKIAVVVRTID